MALIIKDSNDDLKTIANKSDKWAVYNTKAAAEDALANDELAEGMIVGVVSTTEDAFNPDYSTVEIKTGAKWIDGKTIYRRVLTLSSSLSFAGTTWNNTNIDMTGVDTLINFMFISNSCAMNGFYTRITSNKLQVYTLTNVTTGVTGPIVLEYTKTGD